MNKNEKLLINGIIYTLEKEKEKYKAMLIRNGKIIELFKSNPKELLNTIDKNNIIDAKGKTVLPGFTDSHVHFMGSAVLKEAAMNISEINNGKVEPHDLEGVREKIKKIIKNRKVKQPLFCFNYIIPSIKERRLPNRFELDEWFPERVIIILSMDGHSSAYTTKALKILGLYNDKSNGILSGKEHEFNIGKLNNFVMKNINLKMFCTGIQSIVNQAINFGIVSIHCLEGFDDNIKDISISFLIRSAKIIPLYLRLYVQYKKASKVLPYLKYMNYPRIGGCMAWEMDGSISSHTAAFYESYIDQPGNSGSCYYTVEEIKKYVEEAHNKGFQITAHAIGPKGIETILSAYELVFKENNETENRLRHRIDHFEFPTKDQVSRAIDKLNLIITAQPGWAWMDEKFQKSYRKYLHPKQFNMQIPLKTIVKKGGILCGSSDSPVQTLNPFIQIHGMVNFSIKSERLSVYEALRTYTYNGAYSTFEEDKRGTLSPGKSADFIILDNDPFKINKSELFKIKVLETYIQGKKVNFLNDSTLLFLLKCIFGRRKKI